MDIKGRPGPGQNTGPGRPFMLLCSSGSVYHLEMRGFKGKPGRGQAPPLLCTISQLYLLMIFGKRTGNGSVRVLMIFDDRTGEWNHPQSVGTGGGAELSSVGFLDGSAWQAAGEVHTCLSSPAASQAASPAMSPKNLHLKAQPSPLSLQGAGVARGPLITRFGR